MHIRKRLISLAAAGLAAGLVLAACGGGDDGDDGSQGFEDCAENPTTCNSGEAQDGGEMTWVVTVAPDAWMSGSAAGGSVYSLQMHDGLLPYVGDGNPDATYRFNMDLLAAEPELLSEDPFSWQLQLNEDAVWSDGTPITADDFIATWYLSTTEESDPYCVGCEPRVPLDTFESIEGSDDGKTVTITLKEGISDPEYFSEFGVGNIWGGILPWHIAEQNGFDLTVPEEVGEYFQWLHETRPTWSGGPWMIVDGELTTEVIKEPNPQWYGEAPPLETLTIRFLTDPDGWIPALNNDEIHGAAPPDIDPDIVDQLRGTEGVRVNIGSGPAWEHLDVNLYQSQLQDVELRRAIFTAVSVDEIASRNFGDVYPEYDLRRNYSFTEAGALADYFVDVVEGTGFGEGNIEEARSILATAGYEGAEEGGTLTLDGETVGPFRLTSTDTEQRNTAKLLIQDALSQIGLEVTIETTDTLGETLAGAQDGAWDLVVFGWSGNPALWVNNAFQYAGSESPNNFGGYDNPDYDELADQARFAESFDAAAQAANAAYEVLMPDAYILPMYNVPVYVFVTEDYVNVRDNCCSSLRALYNSHQWGLAVQ
jgi:peptide/nickel transport system substrate-binding protein